MRPLLRQALATVALGGLVLGASPVLAVEGGSPYGDIVVRNAFGLKPPEPPKAPEPPKEEAAPSNIFMTGVTSIGGKKQLYLKLVTPGEKEPKYLQLGENERDGAIEVVEIMPKSGRARIKNRGVTQTISFESNGAVASAAPAVTPLPGRPGTPGMPTPPGVPPPPVSANNAVTAKPVSSTLPVAPNNTAVGSSPVRPTGTMNQSQPSTRTIPSRPLRVSPSGGGASYQAPAAAPNINPTAQAVLIEANRQVQPADFPPLPPTPISQ